MVEQEGLAICPVEGGRYRILYQRPAPSAVPAPVPLSSVPLAGRTCVHHPNAAATRLCADCGKALCELCTFSLSDGRYVCPDCATHPRAVPPPAVDGKVMCLVHPGVPATRVCRVCGAPVCPTCDFAYPGDIHICPRCAAHPHPVVSTSRARRAVIALVLGGIAALAFVGLFTVGAVYGFTHGSRPGDEFEAAVGLGFFFLVLLPTLAGLALSLSSLDRRFTTPPLVWAAVILNGLFLGLVVLLMVIGMLIGGS